MWRKLIKKLTSGLGAGCREIAQKIHAKAVRLSGVIDDLSCQGRGLHTDEVLVDLPINRVVVRGGDILTRTDQGHIGTPNLFFDPERWSEAYEHQKQCGFVFTPRNRVALVALASRIVFHEEFGVVMDQQADRAAKVADVVIDEWVQAARESGLCTRKCADDLQVGNRPTLVQFREDDLALPENWLIRYPNEGRRLAQEINACFRNGLSASQYKLVSSAIAELAFFLNMLEQDGTWTSADDLAEDALQSKLRQHLASRGVPVTEGAEVAGGETDLILYDEVVIENKVSKEVVRDPFKVGPHYEWQARRYSMALCARVAFVVFAYRPADEAALLEAAETDPRVWHARSARGQVPVSNRRAVGVPRSFFGKTAPRIGRGGPGSLFGVRRCCSSAGVVIRGSPCIGVSGRLFGAAFCPSAEG